MKPDYITRLEKEIEELGSKIKKLNDFIQTDVFDSLDIESQALMMAQESTMDAYLVLIELRLHRYKHKGK